MVWWLLRCEYEGICVGMPVVTRTHTHTHTQRGLHTHSAKEVYLCTWQRGCFLYRVRGGRSLCLTSSRSTLGKQRAVVLATTATKSVPTGLRCWLCIQQPLRACQLARSKCAVTALQCAQWGDARASRTADICMRLVRCSSCAVVRAPSRSKRGSCRCQRQLRELARTTRARPRLAVAAIEASTAI